MNNAHHSLFKRSAKLNFIISYFDAIQASISAIGVYFTLYFAACLLARLK